MEHISSSTPKARKNHQCNYCLGEIEKGEIYQSAVIKSDYVYTWKNHILCQEIANHLKMEGDEGITYQDFHEYITEEYQDIMTELDQHEFKVPKFLDRLKVVIDVRLPKKTDKNTDS